MDHLCFFYLVFVMPFVFVCLFVLCGHLLGNGCPFGSRLWCLIVSLSLLDQVWYLIVLIPDICTLTYFDYQSCFVCVA